VALYISAPSLALFGPRLRLDVNAEMSAEGPASAFLLPLRARLLQVLPLNYSEALLVETHIPQAWVPVTLLNNSGGLAECPDMDPSPRPSQRAPQGSHLACGPPPLPAAPSAGASPCSWPPGRLRGRCSCQASWTALGRACACSTSPPSTE
jgi:hypothetical protein